MVWYKQTGPIPKRHDHVGHMAFAPDEAVCHGCGQRWDMKVEVSGSNDRPIRKCKWVVV